MLLMPPEFVLRKDTLFAIADEQGFILYQAYGDMTFRLNNVGRYTYSTPAYGRIDHFASLDEIRQEWKSLDLEIAVTIVTNWKFWIGKSDMVTRSSRLL